jgi:hypothetical protein
MPTLNRALAAILGLLLIVGGLLGAVEIFVAYVGSGPWVVPYNDWYRRARADSWQNASVRGVFILALCIGLALIALQLKKRPPATLLLRSEADAAYSVDRRSLQRSLVRTAEKVDGIDSARVAVDLRTIRVRARSQRRPPGELQTAVVRAVSARIDMLELARPPRLRVSVRTRGAS